MSHAVLEIERKTIPASKSSALYDYIFTHYHRQRLGFLLFFPFVSVDGRMRIMN